MKTIKNILSRDKGILDEIYLYGPLKRGNIIEMWMKEYSQEIAIDVIRYMREEYGDKLMWELVLTSDAEIYDIYEENNTK